MNGPLCRRSRLFLAAVTLLCASLMPVSARALAVGQLTTNGRTDPLGLAGDDLSLGWAIVAETRGVTQAAYQIRIGLTAGGGDVWDSGRVASDRQIDVPLPADLRLAPATRYHWQVRIWNGDGAVTDWSEPAWFETGLITSADWSGARWITHAEPGGPGGTGCRAGA